MTCSSRPVRWTRSWSAIAFATSLSTEKMSVSLRSNVSAQRWESFAALISCTFTRTASPLFCTLPCRMWATPSCLAISRTSTQHYKSAPENLPEIARQLGVAHILQGSVQKSGDAVRVNVQLIKAANDSHLWADTFDRK